MKKLLLGCFAAFAAVLLCGCSRTLLTDGRYSAAPQREDYAVVYKDLIFLHVKAPANASSATGYWDWAGKYKLEDNGVLTFDMNKEDAREWNFAFQFFKRPGGIVCNDWEKNSSYVLRYESPAYRGSAPTPLNSNDGGSTPTYTDMSSGN